MHPLQYVGVCDIDPDYRGIFSNVIDADVRSFGRWKLQPGLCFTTFGIFLILGVLCSNSRLPIASYSKFVGTDTLFFEGCAGILIRILL